MKPGMLLKSIVAAVCIATTLAVSVTTNPDDVEGFFAKSKSGHTNNWAVLVRMNAIQGDISETSVKGCRG